MIMKGRRGKKDVFEAYQPRRDTLVSTSATRTLLVKGVGSSLTEEKLRSAIEERGAKHVSAFLFIDDNDEENGEDGTKTRTALMDMETIQDVHQVIASTGGHLYLEGCALELQYCSSTAEDNIAKLQPTEATESSEAAAATSDPAAAWQAWMMAAYTQYAAAAANMVNPEETSTATKTSRQVHIDDGDKSKVSSTTVIAAEPVINEAAVKAKKQQEEAEALARACAKIPPTVCLVCKRDLRSFAALEKHFRSSKLHVVCFSSLAQLILFFMDVFM